MKPLGYGYMGLRLVAMGTALLPCRLARPVIDAAADVVFGRPARPVTWHDTITGELRTR